MDKNKRKFQRFIKQEWEDVEFKDLKIGNIFRIFDNGKRYSDQRQQQCMDCIK